MIINYSAAQLDAMPLNELTKLVLGFDQFGSDEVDLLLGVYRVKVLRCIKQNASQQDIALLDDHLGRAHGHICRAWNLPSSWGLIQSLRQMLSTLRETQVAADRGFQESYKLTPQFLLDVANMHAVIQNRCFEATKVWQDTLEPKEEWLHRNAHFDYWELTNDAICINTVYYGEGGEDRGHFYVSMVDFCADDFKDRIKNSLEALWAQKRAAAEEAKVQQVINEKAAERRKLARECILTLLKDEHGGRTFAAIKEALHPLFRQGEVSLALNDLMLSKQVLQGAGGAEVYSLPPPK